MYFHTDNPNAILAIAEEARLAYDNEQRLRIDVDNVGTLRTKRGEGMWSPPVSSTMDPYRETGHLNQQTVFAEYVQRGDIIQSFSNARVLTNHPDGDFHRRITTAMPDLDIRIWYGALVTVLRKP